MLKRIILTPVRLSCPPRRTLRLGMWRLKSKETRYYSCTACFKSECVYLMIQNCKDIAFKCLNGKHLFVGKIKVIKILFDCFLFYNETITLQLIWLEDHQELIIDERKWFVIFWFTWSNSFILLQKKPYCYGNCESNWNLDV